MAVIKIRKLDGRKMVGPIIGLNLTQGVVSPGEKIHVQGHGFFRVVKPRKDGRNASR